VMSRTTYSPDAPILGILLKELNISELKDPLNESVYATISLEQYMKTSYDTKRKELKIPLVYIICLDKVVANHCIELMNSGHTTLKELNHFQKISEHLISECKVQLWREALHRKPFCFSVFTDVFKEGFHAIYNECGFPFLMYLIKFGHTMRSNACWVYPKPRVMYSSYVRQ
jgi:hypothetical protein